MPKVSAVDIALGGQPLWLVAAPYRNGSLWVAVLADGRIEAFVVSGGAAAPIALSPSTVPAGMPPILLVEGDEARLLANPTEDASALTHPAFLPSQSGALAYLEQSGDLILWKGTELARLEAAGLPDARILIDDASRLLLLTGPSGRYQHGVLGDALEASGVALLDTSPSLSMVTQIEMAEPDVVEGISPIWSDLDGDGTREIIVTTSNESVGARIVVFNEAAEQMAAGPPIGRGFRWRHQIAVAPFGPSGELELAAVLTPHIGGQVEYYRLSGSELHIVAMLPGFSSHALGSRNLDAALGGDFDGDGQVELVVPDRAQQTLNGVRRSGDGAEVSWTVPIGGRISTNLTAVTDDDGRLALGAGHDGNGLRIWSP